MRDYIERIKSVLSKLTREDFIDFLKVSENVKGVLIRVCSTIAAIVIVHVYMKQSIPVTIIAGVTTYFIAWKITMKDEE